MRSAEAALERARQDMLRGQQKEDQAAERRQRVHEATVAKAEAKLRQRQEKEAEKQLLAAMSAQEKRHYKVRKAEEKLQQARASLDAMEEV